MTVRFRTRQFLGASSPTQLSRIGVKLGPNSSPVSLQTGRYGRQPSTTEPSFRTLFRFSLRSQETEFYTSRWPNCPSSRTIVQPLSPIRSRLSCVYAVPDIPSLHSQSSGSARYVNSTPSSTLQPAFGSTIPVIGCLCYNVMQNTTCEHYQSCNFHRMSIVSARLWRGGTIAET